MSTSQRTGILPITFITPSLKPGPAHIALSNRQTLLAGWQAGTDKYNLRVYEYQKAAGLCWIGGRYWMAGAFWTAFNKFSPTGALSQQTGKRKKWQILPFYFHNIRIILHWQISMLLQWQQSILEGITTDFINAQKWKPNRFLCSIPTYRGENFISKLHQISVRWVCPEQTAQSCRTELRSISGIIPLIFACSSIILCLTAVSLRLISLRLIS